MMAIEGVPADKVLTCILAGGQSRRMGGGDKALLPLGPQDMLSHILDRLRPQTDSMVLNANGDSDRFQAFGLEVIPDTLDGFLGPLAGVLSCMRHAQSRPSAVSHVLTVSSDSPFLPLNLMTRFCNSTPIHAPVIALATSHDRLHPVFGLWPIALADDLEDWLNSGANGKVLAWAERHDSIEVSFGDDPETGMDPFFNVNTPEDAELASRVFSPGV